MDSNLTGFTNIQHLDPDIIVDLRYATLDNFTHQVVYDFKTAIARTGTANKLANASAIVKKQGFRLKVWDAYRPVASQKKLYEIYPDPTFVAEPDPNFSHQKGVTFDLTLTDSSGAEKPLPTKFDDFTEKAMRTSKNMWDDNEIYYYNILNDAMLESGFTGYINEWWDFRDSQMDEYKPLSANPNDYK